MSLERTCKYTCLTAKIKDLLKRMPGCMPAHSETRVQRQKAIYMNTKLESVFDSRSRLGLFGIHSHELVIFYREQPLLDEQGFELLTVHLETLSETVDLYSK